MVGTSLTKEEAIEENAFQTCTDMKKLDRKNNSIKIGVSMSKAFSSFNFLTVINLSYANMENGGATALAHALKNSAPSLEVAEMAGNNITDEAAPDIANCLAAKQHLKKLNLSKNVLKDEGCVVIAKSMEDLELEYVDLSYNDLRREGALALARVVVKKKGFKMLSIDGNLISVRGIEEVKEIFKDCPKLFRPFDEYDPKGEDKEDGDEKEENVDDADKKLETEVKNFEDEFVTVFIFY